ncbi:MAG: sulfatase-like hydrolase/transferase [Trebonia sp.]
MVAPFSPGPLPAARTRSAMSWPTGWRCATRSPPRSWPASAAHASQGRKPATWTRNDRYRAESAWDHIASSASSDAGDAISGSRSPRAEPRGPTAAGRADRRQSDRLHQTRSRGGQAVLHLHRSLPPAPAGEGAPGLRPDVSGALGMYADLIAEMDHRVGQIVDCVEEAGIAGNTIIVFSSDNATALIDLDVVGGSNGPFRGAS